MVAIRIFLGVLRTFLYFLDMAMLLRAILSWLPIDDDHPVLNIVYMITEPFIYPIRSLLHRFELFRSLPIDVSFMITAMLIVIASALI
jgi:YggT family protein